MNYLHTLVERRIDPSRLDRRLKVRSVVVLGINYHRFDLPPHLRDDPSRGVIAAYAWGDDYHAAIRPLLYRLDAAVRSQTGRRLFAKCLVDTGPVLERDWAQAAGAGFTGKNCCTIVPGAGSWLLLATLLLPEELDYDAPLAAERATCGRCTRCLTACPTDAFVGPYDLDPQRCISYWTIEVQEFIPRTLRPHFGNRIFGCDICQEVCPWNKRLPARTPLITALAAQQARMAPPLLEGFSDDTPYWRTDDAFAERFVRSPLLRAGRAGMLRNVCVALGNWGDPAALPALTLALADESPLARGHAAWAVGEVLRKTGLPLAHALLLSAAANEDQLAVREEIALALGLGETATP
jgi:epoxyqueuosine reductase